jgi:hypothetical protein
LIEKQTKNGERTKCRQKERYNMSDLLHKQNNNMFHYSNYFLSIINKFINKYAGAKAAKAGDKKGAAPAEGGDEFRVSLIDEGRYSSAGGKPLTGNTKKKSTLTL